MNAPHQPLSDLNAREKTILGILMVSVFWLGLFPDSALRNSELAAKTYRELVTTSRLPANAATGNQP